MADIIAKGTKVEMEKKINLLRKAMGERDHEIGETTDKAKCVAESRLQCFLYDVFNYLLSLSRFIKTFSQERGGRLRHTASLSADSDFRTADLLIELSKCRTIVLRSYDCDKWYQSQVG
uniref:Uncharacterized protein n=1 Tax=Cucumis melo TaxID=3656 RepID=A0A9I9EK35_CUCME